MQNKRKYRPHLEYMERKVTWDFVNSIPESHRTALGKAGVFGAEGTPSPSQSPLASPSPRGRPGSPSPFFRSPRPGSPRPGSPDAFPVPAPRPPQGPHRHNPKKRARRRRDYPGYEAARDQGLVVRPRMLIRRPPPLAQRIKQQERPPGRTINPDVINWYTEQAFEAKYEEDDMSKLYPWLFGSQGLYSGIVCPYPCRVVNGACDCD